MNDYTKKRICLDKELAKRSMEIVDANKRIIETSGPGYRIVYKWSHEKSRHRYFVQHEEKGWFGKKHWEYFKEKELRNNWRQYSDDIKSFPDIEEAESALYNYFNIQDQQKIFLS